jgi:hypothetical protein
MAQTEGRPPNPQLVPPDERFWQRYSPHAEFPLSSVGSLTLHLLLFGILGLIAWLGAMLFSHGNRSLPVEAVRLDLGGGGGNPHGQGDGPNNGEPREAGSDQPQDGATETAPPDTEPRPKKIDVAPGTRLQMKFDDDYFKETNTQAAKNFQALSKVTSRLRLSDGKTSGYGKGGTGRGGGSGSGRGTGIGDGEGEGHGKLTKREKRMLRWTMLFRPQTPTDYVDQLRGLGAILAFPIPGTNEFQVVRDLSARPPRFSKEAEEEVKKLNRIYWFDNDPRSAAQVLNVLGLRLQPMPEYFIAFFPEEVEQKLHQREEAYLNKRYPGQNEESITETKFRLVERGGTIEPEVSALKIKKR